VTILSCTSSLPSVPMLEASRVLYLTPTNLIYSTLQKVPEKLWFLGKYRILIIWFSYNGNGNTLSTQQNNTSLKFHKAILSP
jgi:hypothetical protein